MAELLLIILAGSVCGLLLGAERIYQIMRKMLGKRKLKTKKQFREEVKAYEEGTYKRGKKAPAKQDERQAVRNADKGRARQPKPKQQPPPAAVDDADDANPFGGGKKAKS